MKTLKTEKKLLLGSLLLASIIFIIDVNIPLGVAGGVPYILLVLVSLWSPLKRFTILMAILGSLLTIVGFFISPSGGELWKVLSNRFLALFAIWVTTILTLYRKKSEDKIKELNYSLEKYANEMEKLAEERSKQLIHADRLSSLGTMSAGVAHEINNPLSFISTNLQLLERIWKKSIRSSIEEANKKNVNKNLSTALDEISRMVDGMREGVRRITTIVNNLNSFSRKTESNFELLNILDIIKRAVEFSRFDASLKYKVKIQLDLAEDIPHIKLHRQEIEQVLINLLVNAGHSMENITDGRELLLKIKALHINENVVIEVADNGCGMDEEILDHIFDPFYTTKEAGKGTGLGLSICHGIIDKYGGDITATSTIGKGTTFVITLPLNPQKVVNLRQE